MAAPQNPASSGLQEIHAKAERYDGMARGRVSNTRMTVLPGRAMRVVTQAPPVPNNTLATVTIAIRKKLLTMRSHVRSWKISSHTFAVPREKASTTK